MSDNWVPEPDQEDYKLQPLDTAKEPVIESQVNLDELIEQGQQQKHIWVKRGAKISCEGAQHPHHSHFLIQKKH